MPLRSTPALINTAALRRLRRIRAVEDALGMLVSALTFSLAIPGMIIPMAEGE